MHLFVCKPRIEQEIMYIDDERVIKYMSRVLRMHIGQECYVQWQSGGESNRRYVSLLHIEKKNIVCSVMNCQKNVKYLSNIELLVALPNTFSKCELIVQKCTEIGVDAVYFWRGEKSIIPTISQKRMERLRTIALESVEQCKRWSIPEVVLVEDPRKICEQKTVIAFDFVDGKQEEVFLGGNILGVVGPEGHFGEKDYVFLREVGYVPCSLGEHILRTETAAIVGAWYLCNMK